MFINYTKKFIFLRVTKTGSTSVQHCLIDNYDKNDVISHAFLDDGGESFVIKKFNCDNIHTLHLNVNEIIDNKLLTHEEILNYKIYGVIRDPVDRFLSGAYQLFPIYTRESNDAFIRRCLNNFSRVEWVFLPQYYWLTYQDKLINNIYLYEDIPLMVNDILNKKVDLTYKHRSSCRLNRECNISDSLKKEIYDLYPRDYEIYLQHRRNI